MGIFAQAAAKPAPPGLFTPPAAPVSKMDALNNNDPVAQFGIGAGKAALQHLQDFGNLIAKPLAAGIDKVSLKPGQTPIPVGIDPAKLERTGTAQNVGGAAETAAEILLPSAKGTTALVKAKLAGTAAESALNYALKFGAPKITPAVEEAALAKGTQGVTEGGLFKKATIVPTPRTQTIADAVNGVIDPTKSDLQNIDLVNQHIARTNDAVKSYIQGQNNVTFDPKELRAALGATMKDHAVVFASDPTAERTYKALINEFISHVGDKNAFSLFQARQSFDKVPAVQKLLDGLKGATGENLRRQAVLDIRGAANDFIADLLPEGNPYKPFMQKESRMIEAVMNQADKLQGKTINKNAIQTFIKNNPYVGPLLKYIIPTGVATAGAGAYLSH